MHFLKVAIGDPAHTEALFLDEIQINAGWYQKWRVISEVEGDIRKLNVQWTQFYPDIADITPPVEDITPPLKIWDFFEHKMREHGHERNAKC